MTSRPVLFKVVAVHSKFKSVWWRSLVATDCICKHSWRWSPPYCRWHPPTTTTSHPTQVPLSSIHCYRSIFGTTFLRVLLEFIMTSSFKSLFKSFTRRHCESDQFLLQSKTKVWMCCHKCCDVKNKWRSTSEMKLTTKMVNRTGNHIVFHRVACLLKFLIVSFRNSRRHSRSHGHDGSATCSRDAPYSCDRSQVEHLLYVRTLPRTIFLCNSSACYSSQPCPSLTSPFWFSFDTCVSSNVNICLLFTPIRCFIKVHSIPWGLIYLYDLCIRSYRSVNRRIPPSHRSNECHCFHWHTC